MKRQITRRHFIQDSATVAASLAVASPLTSKLAAAETPPRDAFTSSWQNSPDRIWIGNEFWANPLQDWRITKGRLECATAASNRNVHLLTRQLSDRKGSLQMSVRVGHVDGGQLQQRGSFGFRIGILGPLGDYRNNLFYGKGLDCGVDTNGRLFIGSASTPKSAALKLNAATIELRLTLAPNRKGKSYQLNLTAHDTTFDQQLGSVTHDAVPADQLSGNVALVANYPQPGRRSRRNRGRNNPNQTDTAPAMGQFWFSDWQLSGSKLEKNEDHVFGPVLFSQYTLSAGTLKLTAQMPPIGETDSTTLRLQVPGRRRIGRRRAWTDISAAPIHPEARTATFRIEDWEDDSDTPYRLVYSLRNRDGSATDHYWTGTIRQDPVSARTLTVANVSCNAHYAFPNNGYVAKMAQLNPDLITFTGDQFYEPTAGYGVQRSPLNAAILDLLRKWYVHGWTWRELLRDRPSIAIPDDHDVYQGNIWGEGGGPKQERQEMGGYGMDPTWVNVVHRTQTSHHPDPFDPAPAKRGISVYYGALLYGRISFAIIADRQFKSGPDGKVPPTGGRADHVKDPRFNPAKSDLPGLELLGDRQMKFLRRWNEDWAGADMKAVVSQTIFTAMATSHGGNRMRLVADYDTNAWPQTPRNQALAELRKGFAFHIAGDQHLPAVIHYGIDEHRDAGVAFAGPAVNNLYPRSFEPAKPGKNRKRGAATNTGDFRDSFDHPLTVHAVANPKPRFRKTVLEKEHDKAAGIGIVRFDKRKRTITVECWPYLADTFDPYAQFPGWPVTVSQLDNYARKPVAFLPHIKVRGTDKPVLHLFNEQTGELVYALRLPRRTWQPHVFAVGKYTIQISEPETGRLTKMAGVEARPENNAKLELKL